MQRQRQGFREHRPRPRSHRRLGWSQNLCHLSLMPSSVLVRPGPPGLAISPGWRGSELGGWGGGQRAVRGTDRMALGARVTGQACRGAASPTCIPGLYSVTHSVPRTTPGNLLFLKSSTRPSFLPLGLLNLGTLHLPEPPRGGVLGWAWAGEGGWVLTGSWALGLLLAGPPPPARPAIPAGSRREAGVGATSQGNFCSCPEQTQAGDRASPWLPRRPGPLEFMFIFTVWIPWT